MVKKHYRLVEFYEPLKSTCEIAQTTHYAIDVEFKNVHPKIVGMMRLFSDRYEKVDKLGKRINELFK
jgi:hypothetical protein